MNYWRIVLFAFCQMALMCGYAQETSANLNGQPEQTSGMPATPAAAGSETWIDLSGYLAIRRIVDDALNQHDLYEEYSGSLFLSKTIGNWRFHAEFNAGNSPEFNSESILLTPPHPGFVLKLDSGFVNYNARDWLQFQAGFLFVPTYWRAHHYQSTTLTVDDPLIDENIFPSAFKGGMIYGSHFFGEGGFSYQVYGGVDQLSELVRGQLATATEHSNMFGGKLVFHVPTSHLLDTLDVAFQRLRRMPRDGRPDDVYGAELHLGKRRVELLSEFAHASIDTSGSSHAYIREGYYIQPSYRLVRQLFLVGRYDRLDRDSRFADENRLGEESIGLTYRPVPTISLKLEGNRMDPQFGRLPPYYGVTGAIVYFFHRP